jgi:hypothetical protein
MWECIDRAAGAAKNATDTPTIRTASPDVSYRPTA